MQNSDGERLCLGPRRVRTANQNSFSLLTGLSSWPRISDAIVLGLEYIRLAPGFVREVVDVYYEWEGMETVPMKIKELMMVLQIEVDRLYKPNAPPPESEKPKTEKFTDTRLG